MTFYTYTCVLINMFVNMYIIIYILCEFYVNLYDVCTRYDYTCCVFCRHKQPDLQQRDSVPEPAATGE